MRRGSLLLAFLLALPAFGGSSGKKPALEIRPSPRFAFSPANVLFTLELKGGDDLEEYYCPEIDWFWDDGGKSDKESDCPPFEAGVSKIERHYTEEHEYQRSGVYRVQVSLLHSGRIVARQTVEITVRPGLGDTAQ